LRMSHYLVLALVQLQPLPPTLDSMTMMVL
jgi:hypothetical protein